MKLLYYKRSPKILERKQGLAASTIFRNLTSYDMDVPLLTEKVLTRSYCDSSTLRVTTFDYDFENDIDRYQHFSFTLFVEVQDDFRKVTFSKSFITARQKVIDKIADFDSAVLDNPEEHVIFQANEAELVYNDDGVPLAYGDQPSSKPLGVLCLKLKLMRPERLQRFIQLQQEKISDASDVRGKRRKTSFYRMVVLETAVTLGFSAFVAKYILEQDSSLSTALLATSPYVFKDIAKLHNWLKDLMESLITDSFNVIKKYSIPLLITKGQRNSVDVPLSDSARLESNLSMCLGVIKILTALIDRIKNTNPGRFGTIPLPHEGDEGVLEDVKALMEELLEMDCLMKIIRCIKLMLSCPEFCLEPLRQLSSIYSQRILAQGNYLISAIPSNEIQGKLCIHNFIDALSSSTVSIPPTFDSANTNEGEGYEGEGWDFVFLPLLSLKEMRGAKLSIDEQQESSSCAFTVLFHISMDCLRMSPISPGPVSKRQLTNFGQAVGRACGLSNIPTLLACWAIDANADDAYTARFLRFQEHSELKLIVYALNQLLALTPPRWAAASDLLSIHFHELFNSNPQSAFYFASAISLKGDVRNWKHSLNVCRNHMKLLGLNPEQSKLNTNKLLECHIELAASLDYFDSEIINVAVNLDEQEIMKTFFSRKIEHIFVNDVSALSDSNSVQFKIVHVFILHLLKTNQIEEARFYHDKHVDSLLGLRAPRLIQERSKLIDSVSS